MCTRKALLIINPISGTWNKQGLSDHVTHTLADYDIGVTTAFTRCSGDATLIARQACDDGVDMVLAAGGDGTVNEIAATMCGRTATLGIIPCGSGNGLARHLNIPVDIRGALDVIAQGNSMLCDHGTLNDHPFFCTCGTGFDAVVSSKFAASKRRGKLSYLANTVREYVNYRPDQYIISANGQVISDRAFLVAICNASQYGNNAYIAPQASITDGLLDVTIVHYGNPITTALIGVDLMAGMIDKNMLIHTFRTNNLTIKRKCAAPVHIDGEPLELDATLHVKCHHATLNIFTPGPDQPVVPFLTPIGAMVSDVKMAIRNIFDNITKNT